VADVNEIKRALAGAINKRILKGAGKLSEVTTANGVVQVTFVGVSDDAPVFDTISAHSSICESSWKLCPISM
jgi:hypothetical protein